MCWFVTIGIHRTGVEAVEQLRRGRGGMGVRPSVNPSLATFFPADDARFEVTSGHCSCDLWLATHTLSDQELARRRKKYEQKGWSTAKIDRALRATDATNADAALSEAALRFREAIAALVGSFGSVRLFAHFYSGSQDTEIVTAEGMLRVELSAFDVGAVLPADVLVEISK